MKKIPNNIRIGMVRRGSIPLNSNEYQPASVISEPTNQHPVKQQQWQGRLSLSTPNLRKPKNDSLHEIPTKTKWSTKKKAIVGTMAALAVAAVITVSIVVPVLLTRSTDTTASTTSATTRASTTVARNITTAYWSFDNSTTDFYNVYHGQPMNSPTFTPFPSNTTPYVGYGQALILSSASFQYISIPTFLNLSYTSFTIETWIYSTSNVGDRGVFGQCSCSTCSNQCLYFILRSGRLYTGFTANDLSGTTTLSINIWHHVTFVYNYQTQQQILYLNGVQDGIKSNAQPYQGTNTSSQIGSTQVYSTTNYFQGYIDNVLLTTRAKSADEILRDASLMVYYSFDIPNPILDNGPNGLNGLSMNNTVTSPGRVNQALRFSSTPAFFQAYGFFNLPNGVTNTRSFSISMWIYPTSSSSFTFVQTFSSNLGTGACTNLLGVYSPASTMGQLLVVSSNNGPALITGPFISQNNWTHISVTYSSSNGYTLYVNGSFFGSTGSVTYPTSGTFSYLFIGYISSCSGGAVNFAYQGSIDEVYVHNRELTQADVTGFANP